MYGIPTVTIAKTELGSGEATDSVTLTVDTSPLSFTALHLIVRINAISDATGDGETVQMRFNGDTGNNYNQAEYKGVDTTESRAQSDDTSAIPLYDIIDTANAFSGGEYLIPDAFTANTHKAGEGHFGQADTAIYAVAGRWANKAAITSVTLLLTAGNFDEGSTFELCVVDEGFAFGSQQVKTDDASGYFSVGSITAVEGNLICIGNLRDDRSLEVDIVKMHFGTGGGSVDTTATNYERQRLLGSTANSGLASNNNSDTFSYIAANTAPTDAFSPFIALIPNYEDGTMYRTFLAFGGVHATSTMAYVQTDVMTWRNTGAITSFSLEGYVGSNFLEHSSLSTYIIPSVVDENNLISRIEVGAGDTSYSELSATSIPDTYDHLEITGTIRLSHASTSHFNDIFVNGEIEADNLSSYQYIDGSGTSVGGNAFDPGTGLVRSNANSAAPEQFSPFAMTVFNYKKTDRHKHIMVTGGYIDEDDSDDAVYQGSKRAEITAAINRIDIDPNAAYYYMAGSVYEVRGVSATIPVAGPADIKKINGIAAASIKKVNTIAKASLGKVNSIT